MKKFNAYIMLLFAMGFTNAYAQKSMKISKEKFDIVRQLTIEPGIGIHTNFGTDLLITNLVQWNPKKYLSFAAHSSYNINNLLQRDFNGIKTDYNYSINQKVGVGTTVYSKRSSHSFFLMAGVKYTSFRESLVNPDNQKVSAVISGFTPDYGLMYGLKKGGKKYFFSFRVYLPIYPWPVKDLDVSAVDGNMNNIALECGVGIKIK